MKLCFFIFILSSAIAFASSEVPCPWDKVKPTAQALDYGLNALKHAEKLKSLRENVEVLEAKIAFHERWAGRGGLLSYPHGFVFVAAFRRALEDAKFYESTPKGLKSEGRGPEFVGRTADLLRRYLPPELLTPPKDEAQAARRATEIANHISGIKKELSTYIGIPSAELAEWITPTYYLQLLAAFHRGDLKSDTWRFWNELLEPYFTGSHQAVNFGQFRTFAKGYQKEPFWNGSGWDYGWQSAVVLPQSVAKADETETFTPIASPSGLLNLGERRRIRKENEAAQAAFEARERQRAAQRAQRNPFLAPWDSALLRLREDLAQRNKEIESLVGSPPKPPGDSAPGHYAPPPEVKLAIGDSAKQGEDAVGTVLQYRRELLARYLHGKGFFDSEAAKKLRADTESGYEAALRDFDSTNLPSSLPEGGYHEADLVKFRALLTKHAVTPEDFLRFTNELHALKKDQRARKELLSLLQDRANGFTQMKALEAYQQKPPELPKAYQPTELGSSHDVGLVPYVRQATPPVVFHRALTALASETARRGELSTKTKLLAELAEAAKRVANDATREQALQTLSPAIEVSLARASALGQDFLNMQRDLHQLKDHIDAMLARRLTEAQAKVVAAPGPEAPAGAQRHHTQLLEELELEIDELRSQAQDAAHLQATLETLQKALRTRRETLNALSRILRRPDPNEPNRLDPSALRSLLEAVEK